MRPCRNCGQETKGNPNRVWWNSMCFCSRGCIQEYKRKIAEQEEKRRKQTIAERQQQRLEKWSGAFLDNE